MSYHPSPSFACLCTIEISKLRNLGSILWKAKNCSQSRQSPKAPVMRPSIQTVFFLHQGCNGWEQYGDLEEYHRHPKSLRMLHCITKLHIILENIMRDKEINWPDVRSLKFLKSRIIDSGLFSLRWILQILLYCCSWDLLERKRSRAGSDHSPKLTRPILHRL